MTSDRLEAFTDGVVAIIITIMVLELKTPSGTDAHALRGMVPIFLVYVLSYVNVGIFWSNHHHMLHVSERVDGSTLWANLTLMFFLSLVPFAIRWMDEGHYAALPTAFYGAVLLGAAIGYRWLQASLIRCNGPDSPLAQAVGIDRKGYASLVMYLSAIPLAFVATWVALALYVGVALLWLVPDRRIESRVLEG